MEKITVQSWQMVEPKSDLVLNTKEISGIKSSEAVVEIAGCGLCHTDLSFWYYGVQTKHAPPLTLGHEISGTVVAGPAEWAGKKVIIPAVLPCGECELCKKGRSNVCRKQLMPGNDFDGGFATHVVVPYRFLCPVPDKVLKEHSLERLSVIADAVSTPYQVMKKSELEAGDLAIAIGVGGVGIFGALLAKIFGAKVIAIDISDKRLQIAGENGIDAVINSTDLDVKAVKEKVKEISRQLGTPSHGWKIFEFSGTKGGQELAFGLLTFASTLSVVGFTMDRLELRLSNLMAFDAKLIGTWGCMPELYPEVLELVSGGKLNVEKFTETFPLSQINDVLRNTLSHKYTKRSILTPHSN